MSTVKTDINRFNRSSPASISAFAGTFLLVFCFILIYYFRFKYTSPFAGSWDEADFALALDRFDLLAMQPHFPGYPYFILGGKLFHHWIENPALSLSLFNAAMNLLSCVPIYLLARRKLSLLLSLLVTLVIQSSMFTWLLTAQPMSEAAAIALLWWYVWSIQHGLDRSALWAQALPLFCFSLLMGVRLSYFIVGAGLIYLWVLDWRRGSAHRSMRLLIMIMLAAVFQLIWIAGLVMSEGSIQGFITLSGSFINGHFQDWGGSVNTSTGGWGERLVQLIWFNMFWSGLSGHSVIIAAGMGLLIAAGLASRFILPNKYNRLWILWLIVLYGVYVFLAQNIDKPRHIAPFAVIGFFLFISDLLQTKGPIYIKRGLVVLMALLMLYQSFVGIQLVKEVSTEPPASYQLAEYLKHVEGHFIIYTWEESRVMDYLQMSYLHKRVFTYEYFKQEAASRGLQRIYLTNHVLQGFENQGMDVRNQVTKLDTFRSNPLVDPVYNKIILYEWNNK